MSNICRERLDRLLSRLGYGTRKQVAAWVRQGLIEVNGEPAVAASQKVDPACVCVNGEALDFPYGLTVLYHKPVGAVCSHREQGRLIYDDFPLRWSQRKPPFSSVGRLDKETSGLLIVTDNGQLNHALTSPKHGIGKTYRARLARPLRGDEIALFASGRLLLEGEQSPCLPALAVRLGDYEMDVTVFEGRYHQIRRMFAAVGNHVEALHRRAIGALTLEALALAAGEFRAVDEATLLTWIEQGIA